MKEDFYVLLDIDGCITDGKNQPMDVFSCYKLQQYIKQNQLNVLLCTGRSATYVEAICQLLHINHWCICENGCYLYHPITDEILINPTISLESLNHLKDLEILLNHQKHQENFNIELGKEVCISLNPINESITSLYQRIRQKLDLTWVDITHSATAVDITPKNINKGDGYDFWYHQVNQKGIQTIGIGDSKGDIPFLNKSNIVACPNNASQEVKGLANIIAKAGGAIGVLEILETIFGDSV